MPDFRRQSRGAHRFGRAARALRTAALPLAALLSACESEAPLAVRERDAGRPAVASGTPLRIDASAASIAVGTAGTLHALRLDASGSLSTAHAEWRSATPTVAAVANDGSVFGLAPGVAVIWAIVAGDSVATAVDVGATGTGAARRALAPSGGAFSTNGVAPVKWLGLSSAATRMTAGQAFQFVARPVDQNGRDILPAPRFIWRSSAPGIASIDSVGRVTALTPGQTFVSVLLAADTTGPRAMLSVTVVPAAGGTTGSLFVTPSSGRLRVGDSLRVTAAALTLQGAFLPGRPVTYTSSDTRVVTTVGTGILKAVGVGSAIVLAACDGYSQIIPVAVESDPIVVSAPAPTQGEVGADDSGISIDGSSVVMITGDSVQLAATVIRGAVRSALPPTASWVSSDPAVAVVRGTGLVVAVGAGAARVAVSSNGSVAGIDVTVTSRAVTPPPAVPATPETPAAPAAPATPATPAPATPAPATPAPATPAPAAPTPATPAPATPAPATPAPATPAPSDSAAPRPDTTSATTPSGGTSGAGSSGGASGGSGGAAGGSGGSVGSGAGGASTPPPLVGGIRIPLTVRRFDGGSGRVLVSNGIPLLEGVVRTSDLAQIHVLVNGVEQPIAVRALSGRFSSGSLRSILVQFTYDVPNAREIGGVLVIGAGQRNVATVAEVAAPSIPAAAALPTDPAYLIASRWGGTLYASTTRAPSALAAQFDTDYVRLELGDWARCGVKWDCARTAGYDRPFILYQQWLRTGDPAYWYRATATADDYITRYIVVNGGPTPWWSNSEGVALHYWATGREASRYQLRKMAETLAWMARPGMGYEMNGTLGDDRMRAKILTAAIDAARLDISTQPSDATHYYTQNDGVPYYASFLTPSTLSRWVTDILSTQRANGMFGGAYYGGGQSNYMVGMLLSALVRYHEEVSPDQRILAAVKKSLDDLWANEWDATERGFQYHSLRGTDEGGRIAATASPQPGLNAFIFLPAAWYYHMTGDTRYSDMGDEMLRGLASPGSRDWWNASGKAFDQAFYRIFNALAWRGGS